MPNRILREGILSSERVNALNWEEEVFYRRLMSVADDYGRFTAHPTLLRASLYPLKLEAVREANMERLLAACEKARLVRLYEVEGKKYLVMLDFRQQIRAKASKYPPPPDDPVCSTCAADATHVRTKAQAQSETKAEAQADQRAGPSASDGERLSPARMAALEAFEAWSACKPPIGRGHSMLTINNEHAKVFALVEELDQAPPIVRRGELVGRHLLVAQAVDALRKQGKPFKAPAWAVGCVRRELEDWASGNGAASPPKRARSAAAVREDN